MKNIKYIAIFLLFFSCEETRIDIDKFGTVSGTILDGESYTPLSGVLIATNPASSSALTDDNGNFKFEKIKIGETAISARKKDYMSGNISVAIYESDTTSVVFYILKDEGDVGWVQIYEPVPGNGSVEQNVSMTFVWKVDQQHNDKQLEYTLFYYESNSTTQKVGGENLLATEVTVSDLKLNTIYYWYVVAKYEGRRVANSPTWTFKTKAE